MHSLTLLDMDKSDEAFSMARQFYGARGRDVLPTAKSKEPVGGGLR
ncbi:unnamed protein product [Anisakis simplex]|uniref:Ornithine cyclodeaminase n=1 Tax=Anisakis simplex TaxID=6269 RepID=A0A0M3JKI6_ANISI|nr:unnamed protein product [Anisakis simplex]